jgi:hypothetical protein
MCYILKVKFQDIQEIVKNIEVSLECIKKLSKCKVGMLLAHSYIGKAVLPVLVFLP